jgi:hypothetical protein
MDARLVAFRASIFFFKDRRRRFMLSKTATMSVQEMVKYNTGSITSLDSFAILIFEPVDVIAW